MQIERGNLQLGASLLTLADLTSPNGWTPQYVPQVCPRHGRLLEPWPKSHLTARHIGSSLD